jgi:hypothetical protein
MSTAARAWTAAAGSLVPWAALLAAVTLVDGPPAEPGVVAAPYLVFVALPSFLAALAGRSAAVQVLVLVVLTAVAAWAGVEMATTEDAQAGLAVLLVPFVALPLGVAVAVGSEVAAVRRAGHGSARRAAVSERLAALAVDVILTGAVLWVPAVALSGAGHEVAAAVLTVVFATTYVGGSVAVAGRTAGQRLLDLTVVHVATGGRVPPGRAVLRSFVVVVEVVAAPSITFGVPALAELTAVATTGRSLTDRLVGTAVVTARARVG